MHTHVLVYAGARLRERLSCYSAVLQRQFHGAWCAKLHTHSTATQ
jgi:hypothetical protein